MDPLGRMLLEHAYEAIIDAGVNPRELRGTNTGVFIGTCYSESECVWYYETRQVRAFRFYSMTSHQFFFTSFTFRSSLIPNICNR